jgi:two-component system OmpR family sensor kinase
VSFLARLPVRVRVTLAFTAVIAVLLAATGLFLYLRLGSTLGAGVDRALRSRAGDLTLLVRQADSGLAEGGRSQLTAQGENLAQIIDTGGRVVDAPPPLRARRLLNPGEVRRAARGTILVDHDRSPVGDDTVRLLATPVAAQGRRLVVVVGASLEPSQDAQANLGRELLLGGPVALLLAALAGYGAAAGALRPVELMRRRASEIQAGLPGRRLPVPPSRDEVARLGETLNEMLERLEEAFARERAFVSDASHESIETVRGTGYRLRADGGRESPG